MGVGKYYCDYCEKQFQDSPFGRKRHLESLSHQKAKALWFDSFFPKHSNIASTPRLLCNPFITTGFCQYGDSCKYFHPNNNNNNPPHYSSSSHHPITAAPGIPQNNQFLHRTSFTGSLVSDRMGTSWGNLPPSLMPPPEAGYPALPFVDWG